MPQNLPPVVYDLVRLAGGLDQITSAYELPPGSLRDCVNFACRPYGGYYRIPGYERFSGQPQPHKALFVPVATVLLPGKTLSVGETGVFGNTTGTVCHLDPFGKFVGLTNTAMVNPDGTLDSDVPCPFDLRDYSEFVGGPIVINGDTRGDANAIYTDLTSRAIAVIKASAANIWRATIGPVPGSGPLRGVVWLNDTAYAFRDNAAGTAGDIYKSTPNGWTHVPLGQKLDFTDLKGTLKEGDVLSQGVVSATVERWVITEGTIESGVNAGYFVLSGLTGGDFIAGVATVNGEEVTLAGAQAPISLQPGGAYNFSIGNFSAYYATARIYGADGINDAFEFDGEVYVPIKVAADHKPRYAVVHSNHLFLAVASSVIHSALGNPYNFEVVNGAGEIGTGGLITGMLILPGNQGTSALEVVSRSSTWILYGSSSQDWRFVNYNVGVGALDRTLQNLFDAFACDDHGITMMKQSLNYGNFDGGRITHNIQKLIQALTGTLACSGLSRANSQYRVFYENGYGIYSTVTPQGVVGHGVVLFPDPVICAFDGEDLDGRAMNLFGTSDGYVMLNDVGTSFDGKPIPAYLNTNINAVKSPRIRKRFRRAVMEIHSEAYVEFDLAYNFEWASPDILPHLFAKAVTTLSGLPFWDNMIWDTFYWDGKTMDAVSVNLEGTGENLQMNLVSEADFLEQFTLQSVVFHYSQRRGNR